MLGGSASRIRAITARDHLTKASKELRGTYFLTYFFMFCFLFADIFGRRSDDPRNPL